MRARAVGQWGLRNNKMHASDWRERIRPHVSVQLLGLNEQGRQRDGLIVRRAEAGVVVSVRRRGVGRRGAVNGDAIEWRGGALLGEAQIACWRGLA